MPEDESRQISPTSTVSKNLSSCGRRAKPHNLHKPNGKLVEKQTGNNSVRPARVDIERSEKGLPPAALRHSVKRPHPLDCKEFTRKFFAVNILQHGRQWNQYFADNRGMGGDRPS
jgi:hypothetical protein